MLYDSAEAFLGARRKVVFLFGMSGVGKTRIAALLRLCAPRNVLLYAWCPLVVKEIAFTAHPDGIGVCLAVAAIVLAQSQRFPAAALLLGLASGARILALLLVPFVLDPKAGARLRHLLLFAGVLAGVYLPFLLQGPADLLSLGIFARDWEFNTAVFGLLRPAFGDSAARFLAASLFALFWAFLWLRFRRDTSGSRRIPGDWLYGGLLLLSPVINSWYLLWVLPFAAMAPSVWAWTASLAVLLSYVTGLNLEDFSMQPFEQPLWGRGLEFGLILIALLVDLALRRRRSHLEATS